MLFVFSTIAFLYFAVILTYTLSWYRALRFSSVKSVSLPMVSVVVAAKDEALHISFLLECLLHQTARPGSFEVILVNDHSEDDTLTVATQWYLQHPHFPLRIFTSPLHQHGKKEALQYAVNQASGELILATDADCLPPPRWIDTLREAFSDPDIHICGGLTVYTEEKTRFQFFQSLEFLTLVSCGMSSIALRHPVMCNGANLAYRKASFLAVGGYSHNLGTASGDDIFLMLKIRQHFGQSSAGVCLAADAIVSTHPSASLKAFLFQRLRWAGKTPGTRNGDIYFVSLTIFLMSLSLCVTTVGWCFSSSFFHAFLLVWIVKLVIDYPIIHSITGWVNKKYLRKYYFPLQIFYPFYIVLVAMLSWVVRPTWKNRKI